MASPSSKFHLLLAIAVLILLQHSLNAATGPYEGDIRNFNDETDLDYNLAPKYVNGRRRQCIYIGDCNRREDCKPLCAPMGLAAVRCVTNPAGGKHCCCAIPTILS